jgi:Tol biopolymer transport system component
MSQERGARVRSAVLGRLSRSLLLALALVCPVVLPHAGRAGAGAQRGGALPFGNAGVIAFEAGGEIYVMNVGTGMTTKIVGIAEGSSGDVFNTQPALSPDGSRVAVSGKRDGKFSIYLVNIDGSGLRRLTDGRDFSNDSEPAWSPDGSRIAFASERAGSFDIYTMSSVDGRGVQRLTDSEGAEADPSWSPDGNWIAYTGRLQEEWGGTQCGYMPIIGGPTGGGCVDADQNGTCDDRGDTFGSASGPYIYKMKADGSEQKNLTDTGGAAEPDWSPDGSQVAFVGGRKGEAVNVYLIASDGSGPWVPLTFDGVQETSPSWAGTSFR